VPIELGLATDKVRLFPIKDLQCAFQSSILWASSPPIEVWGQDTPPLVTCQDISPLQFDYGVGSNLHPSISASALLNLSLRFQKLSSEDPAEVAAQRHVTQTLFTSRFYRATKYGGTRRSKEAGAGEYQTY
jgi:hypothetical protein